MNSTNSDMLHVRQRAVCMQACRSRKRYKKVASTSRRIHKSRNECRRRFVKRRNRNGQRKARQKAEYHVIRVSKVEVIREKASIANVRNTVVVLGER